MANSRADTKIELAAGAPNSNCFVRTGNFTLMLRKICRKIKIFFNARAINDENALVIHVHHAQRA